MMPLASFNISSLLSLLLNMEVLKMGMKLFKAAVGLGVFAGAALATLKLMEKLEDKKDGTFTMVAGEFPDGTTVTVQQPEQAEVVYPKPSPADENPNENPVEAESIYDQVRRQLDYTEIAKAEDFQNWDDLGCQG